MNLQAQIPKHRFRRQASSDCLAGCPLTGREVIGSKAFGGPCHASVLPRSRLAPGRIGALMIRHVSPAVQEPLEDAGQ